MKPHLNSGYEYRSTTEPKDAGMTVVEYLSARFPHSTRAEWQVRVEAGLIRVSGRIANASTRLGNAQTVVWSRPPWREPEAPGVFALLYLDPHLLVVAKPRGLPVLPGAGYMQNTLLSLVRKHFPDASPLHRLGRGTSGLVLFARTSHAARQLSREWCRNEVRKLYRALVSGSPREAVFCVDVPIGRIPHERLGTVYAASSSGKPARSDVWVLERRSGETLVEVRIFTGRTHQVRIHMAAAGHPLVGDPFYGPGGVPRQSTEALPGNTGFHLHAQRLEFAHPLDNRRVEVVCAPPPLLRTNTRVAW